MGKLRLDQQVKKFCLSNACRGCFEVKVHFGIHVNPNCIKYDATSKGISIYTENNQRHKYKLFVPFPSNLTLSIPKDPEAQLFCGILSAKIAIVSYDKNDFKKKSKSDKKIDDETKTKESKDSDAKIKKKKVKKMKKTKKMSLDDLNKRIAENADDGSSEPAKKRRKWNKGKKRKQEKKQVIKSNEMTMDDQHELIDGVVDKIELKVKEKRKKEFEKDADIKEYLKNRAERKQKKEQKKKDLREKFLLRRSKKKQKQRKDRKGTSYKKASAKRVTFAL